LLQDLSRKNLSFLADDLHDIIEKLLADREVCAQARENTFDTFSAEGKASTRLVTAVMEKFMANSSGAEKLYDETLTKTHSSIETRGNLLRVVYLRVNDLAGQILR
jgi:hypothetical protein